MMRLRLFVFLLGLFIAALQAQAELRPVRELHYQMGTFLELTIWHSDPPAARRALRQAVQEVHRLEEILSNYDPRSAVSRFNGHGGKGKIRIDADLYRVLKIASSFSTKTSGDFDVTVGPLVELWRQSSAIGRAPGAAQLAEVMRRVDYRNLKLYPNGEAELALEGMKVDLGGIGKGYAVDRIVEILQKAKIETALINFGGSSLYALGHPPRTDGWTVGMKGPDGALAGTLRLQNIALSTSGSLGRFWGIGGRKYGHVIDPKKGLPVSEPRTATVVAPSATAAEALSKPLILRGEPALALIRQFPRTEATVLNIDRAPLWSGGFAAAIFWKGEP